MSYIITNKYIKTVYIYIYLLLILSFQSAVLNNNIYIHVNHFSVVTWMTTYKISLPIKSRNGVILFSYFVHLWLIPGCVARIKRRVLLMEQLLLTFSKHLSAPTVFVGVCVTRSLVLCICFVDGCLSFFLFFLCYLVVCPSSIYGFKLPLLYI